MLAALLAQSSLLVAPMYLDAAPPETRAVAALIVRGDDRMEADAIRDDSARLSERAKYSVSRPSMAASALYGTFPREMLSPEIDAWLFAASDTSVSEPIRTAGGWIVAQRLERDAACRQIFVAGTDANARAKIEAIQRELAAGADLAQLARERSEDRASALRGGALAIFERGPDDALLREAAFRAKVGEVVGPIESPLGLHLIQRVPAEALDPRLRDDVWARARVILIANAGAKGADPALERSFDASQRLADDLAARIRRGEVMAELARAHDDDRGGRERGGDLGWVRRNTTRMPPAFDRLFLDPPGDLIGPLITEFGFVLLRREDPGPRSRIVLRKSPAVDRELWARRQPSAPSGELEERFARDVWPEHERSIDAWRSRLLAAHGTVLEACLDDAMAALRMRDPCLVVEVHMTASPFSNGHSDLDSPGCVDAREQDVDRALESVIAAALRTLDRASPSPRAFHWTSPPGDPPGPAVLSELRANLLSRGAEEWEYRRAVEDRILEQAKASAARAIAIGRR